MFLCFYVHVCVYSDSLQSLFYRFNSCFSLRVLQDLAAWRQSSVFLSGRVCFVYLALWFPFPLFDLSRGTLTARALSLWPAVRLYAVTAWLFLLRSRDEPLEFIYIYIPFASCPFHCVPSPWCRVGFAAGARGHPRRGLPMHALRAAGIPVISDAWVYFRGFVAFIYHYYRCYFCYKE